MPDDECRMTNARCQMTNARCLTAGIKDVFAIRHVSFAMPPSVRFSVPVSSSALTKARSWGLFIAVGELMDQSLAGVVDGPGHDDPELDEKVAIRLAARGGNTLSLESQLQS